MIGASVGLKQYMELNRDLRKHKRVKIRTNHETGLCKSWTHGKSERRFSWQDDRVDDSKLLGSMHVDPI